MTNSSGFTEQELLDLAGTVSWNASFGWAVLVLSAIPMSVVLLFGYLSADLTLFDALATIAMLVAGVIWMLLIGAWPTPHAWLWLRVTRGRYVRDSEGNQEQREVWSK